MLLEQNLKRCLRFTNKCLSLPLDVRPSTGARQTPNCIYSQPPNYRPTPLQSPILVATSPSAFTLLHSELTVPRAEDATDEENSYLASIFSGNILLPGMVCASHCYAGHQFGSFSGQLGDGAAMYLGDVEVVNAEVEVEAEAQTYELQLKGSGLTPYSRTADGRKVLASSIREFLASEAFAHLNIPTTRAPVLVTSTSTRVRRDKFYDGNVAFENCAVTTRLGRSFLRFGSFEIFKPADPLTNRSGPSPGNEELCEKLLNFAVADFYPTLVTPTSTKSEKAELLLRKTVAKTAFLVAQWQTVGFTHGVLNTDNMSLFGLTIDYGPFGFMEHFDWDHVPNGSDGTGRYSYKKQPEICKWNCHKLAEALSFGGALELEAGKKIVEEIFDKAYTACYEFNMRRKLGLMEVEKGEGEDKVLFEALFETMEKTNADFTETFKALENFAEASGSSASLMSVLTNLVECCATPATIKKVVERKMKIQRPGMDPRQLISLWQIAQENPQELGRMFNGPVDAIVEELRGEMGKLEKYNDLNSLREKLGGMDRESKMEADRVLWREFLGKYKERMEVEGGVVGKERLDSMRKVNPRFVLKNWILQDAIIKAEGGDYGGVRELLVECERCYSHQSSGNEEEEKGESIWKKSLMLTNQKNAPAWASDLYNT